MKTHRPLSVFIAVMLVIGLFGSMIQTEYLKKRVTSWKHKPWSGFLEWSCWRPQ